MIPKWLFTIRGRVPTRVALLLGTIPVLIAIVLWWACTRGIPEERVISYNILPSPVEVIQSVPELLTRRELFTNLETSLKRVGIAFLLAVGVALPLGVLMGSFGTFRSMFSPTTTASGYIPIATLLPLTMSWFGTGELQKIVFLSLAFGIYLLPMVIGAIDAVPEVYLKTAATLGATRFDQVFRVLIPVALPSIWHGMRLAFGVGWTYLVLAEAVVMDGGLGTLIVISQRRGPREHIYLVIILITLVAWATDIVWVQLGYLLFPYRRPR
jgi:ABC-type nitrate/sulfonate/bicarbonate transport system permease component